MPFQNKLSRDIAVEKLAADLRHVINLAYSKKLSKGDTVTSLAHTLGWTESKFKRLISIPENINIEEISDLCFTLDIVLRFDLTYIEKPEQNI